MAKKNISGEKPQEVKTVASIEENGENKNEKTQNAAEKETLRQQPAASQSSLPRLIFRLFFLAVIAVTVFLWFENRKIQQQQASLASRLTEDYTGKYRELTNRLQKQEAEIASLKQTKPEIRTTLSESDYNKLYAGLKNDLAATFVTAANTKNATAVNTVMPVTVQPSNGTPSSEVLLASGAMIVKGLADSGQSFAYETEVLEILAQNNEIATKYLDTIRKFSASGIKNPSALIRTFNRIYHDLSRQKRRPEIVAAADSKNFSAQLKKRLNNIISFQKRQPKPAAVLPKEPDTVHELVNTGRFAEALNEINTDPKYRNLTAGEFSVWINQTHEYLEFEQAINGLLMNALANIRLKELNHNVDN